MDSKVLKLKNNQSRKSYLTELYGLPAVGKTTTLNKHPEWNNVNDYLSQKFIVRQIIKLKLVCISFLTEPKQSLKMTFFAMKYAKNRKIALAANLVSELPLLRTNVYNSVSDQGIWQALWSIAATGVKDDGFVDEATSILNNITLPNAVMYLSDDIDSIVIRDINRYGKPGWYYADKIAVFNSKNATKIIDQLLEKYYE